MGVIIPAHPVRGESLDQRNTTGEVATTSPPFYNEPHRSHVLCVKAELRTTFTSWSQHHFVCNRKARAACAQSFTLWQQATIEITRRRDHSIVACSRQVYMGVVLRAHPVRGESHIQRNVNQEVAMSPQKSIFCCANFGCTLAVDVQQKLKPFLPSSKKQIALQFFHGIYSLFV